ncbi:hypothetical protein [Ferrimonas lipolytica]|uniref:Ca-activated chloride channel family protein n=1 Tax=Ferrimonas lipolytica TaxID=2724191 RepID=A0A6H1UDX0_9GAMM|nr:hypothetical protein [Ferrimonas lipolytica]QIZ76533.1 hypothetical protein HER31_06455 [Ferrimonas lipolytica]
MELAQLFRTRIAAIGWHNGKMSLALIALLAALSSSHPQPMADAFFSRDQQARIWFELGRYDIAAQYFDQLQWRAYSFYGAGQFKQTAAILADQADFEDQFARANALAHSKEYYQAQALYRQILTNQPGFNPAFVNLEMVNVLIAAMEKQSSGSKSGKRTASIKPEASKEQKRRQGQKQQQGNGDPSDSNEMRQAGIPKQAWLKQLDPQPLDFLQRKFAMELKQRQQQEHPSDANN